MSRKILLADDSVTAQNMGKKILSDAGYEVITVSNGSAALKKINELRPDIAVLDVYMPGHSGLEVCKQLKANPDTAHIPVLLTVGKLEPFKSDEALKAKANAFIIKPFEASELLAVMRKIEDANPKPAAKPKSAGKSTLAKAFAANAVPEEPDPEAEIQVTGWKNRISMPVARKAEPEPPEEDFSMGTGFRDITPVAQEPSGLRRESSFTADAVAENPPVERSAQASKQESSVAKANAPTATSGATSAELPLDITPDEIAAIKAAVEVLSGEGDKAPVLHIAAAGIEGVTPSRRELAPEPEYSAEVLANPQSLDAKLDAKVDVPAAKAVSVETTPAAPAEEVATKSPAAEEVAQEPAQASVVQTSVPRWRAETAELTAAEASASLEQEMQAAKLISAAEQASHTHNLAEFATPDVPSPVDDEPVLSDVPSVVAPAAESEPETLAVAAAASSGVNAVSNSSAKAEEHADAEKPFTQSFAAVPSLTPEVSRPAAATSPTPQHSTGFQDLRPQSPSPAEDAAASGKSADSFVEVASAAAPQAAPSADRSAPEDEIDSRTKAQMDAAWSNWHDIRNTVVAPKLADQIEEVTEASAKEEAKTPDASIAGARESSSEIASIVDTMLAEMRPKLLEEIARKLAAKKE